MLTAGLGALFGEHHAKINFNNKGNFMLRPIILLSFLLVLSACDSRKQGGTDLKKETATPNKVSASSDHKLRAILDRQPENVQTRYVSRHPHETLTFFGIEPGMTVIEALPGSGWYSKILLPLLGKQGQLIGAGYNLKMLALFGFYDDARLKELAQWKNEWPIKARAWGEADHAKVNAFYFGNMSKELHGTVDAVLFIRALHNMARFSDTENFLGSAIDDAFQALKPGGIAGIVQHAAPENMSSSWASGKRGYLHEEFVIEQMITAGFELVATSNINANEKDLPTSDEVVWRLPPTLSGSKNNAERISQMMEIGESNRMTLKFRKPPA